MQYTNVCTRGNDILYRGVDDKGNRFSEKFEFKPHFCVSGSDENGFNDVFGKPVRKVEFDTIKEARNFVKDNSDIANYDIFGITDYRAQYLHDIFPKTIEFDPTVLKLYNLDIEVDSNNGFPKPELAKEMVTAITIEDWFVGKYYLFTLKDYKHNKNSQVGHLDVTHYKFDSEEHLLGAFLAFWSKNHPDAVTGWNCEYFDIPYLCNRIYNLFNFEYVKRLSPWGVVNKKIKVDKWERENLTFDILGVDSIDYMVIYKKHIQKKRENYRLNTIANIEVGEEKISYDEHKNLAELYEKDPQLYFEYNIKDVELIHRIDDRCRLMDLTFILAYKAKINFQETTSPVKTWENIIYHHLLDKNQYAPLKRQGKAKSGKYKGAFVKNPLVGLHKWIVSFDLASLYPHLIQEFNLGIETILNDINIPNELSHFQSGTKVNKLLNKSIDTSILKKYNVNLAANGQLFSNNQISFLSELMRDLYTERKGYKKKMLGYEQELEDLIDESKKDEYEGYITHYHNFQYAMKILLNSAYGGVGNEYFQFYDIRIAEAITYSGQYVIQWVEQEINKLLNTMFDTDGEDYCVAIDTDSNYYCLDKLVQKRFGDDYNSEEVVDFVDKFCKKVLQPFIDDKFQELADYINAYENRMVMKREVIAESAVWTGKKHYIMAVWDSEGVRYDKFKLKDIGMQSVQSSTPEVCRKALKDVYRMILSDDQDGIINYLKEFETKFKKLPVEDVSTPKTVNEIDKWINPDTIYKKGCPQHVRATINHNLTVAKLDLTKVINYIDEGTSINYVALKEPNPSGTYVIGFEGFLPQEFNIDKYIDYNTQYEKTFYKPIKDVLDVAGYTAEKQLTLDEFFV